MNKYKYPLIVYQSIMYPSVVYKIVSKYNWNNFINSGLNQCNGFENDLKDGFIHLSTHKQLYNTYLKKYNNYNKNHFNIIAVDLNNSDSVKWEKYKNGLIYPHLYSPLILDKNIMWVQCLGKYQFNVDGI